MAALVATKGPNAGQRFALDGDGTLIGRQPDVAVYLDSLSVSRHHARIVCQHGAYFVEDLGSSNGTYVNGVRIAGRVAADRTRRAAHRALHLPAARRATAAAAHARPDHPRQRGRRRDATPPCSRKTPPTSCKSCWPSPSDLGRALELDPVLGRLLDHLLHLFPQADRGMALLCEGDRLAVRADAHAPRRPADRFPLQPDHRAPRAGRRRRPAERGRGRRPQAGAVGHADFPQFAVVFVRAADRLGRPPARRHPARLHCGRARSFQADDLELLTAVCLQASVVVENAALHAEHLREAQLRQELLFARDIQQSFLPTDFDPLGAAGPELFARVQPAREVSGDLYDFFPLPDGRLAFFLGDVSGKGMPAALFMIAVRTLIRHLAPAASGPAELLSRLNAALCADNPTNLYVTLAHGVYDPRDGGVVLALGGHPAPLLRRADGRVETVAARAGLDDRLRSGRAGLHRRGA